MSIVSTPLYDSIHINTDIVIFLIECPLYTPSMFTSVRYVYYKDWISNVTSKNNTTRSDIDIILRC